MSDVYRTFAYQLKHPKCTVHISTQVRLAVRRHEHSMSLDFDGSYYGLRPRMSEESEKGLAAELSTLTFLEPFEPSAELVASILKDVDDHLRVNVMVPLEMREWPEATPGSFVLNERLTTLGGSYIAEHLGESFELVWTHHSDVDGQIWEHSVAWHLSLQQRDSREARSWTPPFALQQEIGEWLRKAGKDLSSIPARIEAAFRAAALAMLDQPVGSPSSP